MKQQREFITSGARAEEVCKKLMEAKAVGTDTETTGLDPHKDKVILLSLSARGKGTYVADTRYDNVLKAFTPLFESEDVTKVLHNAPFDYQMIKGSGGGDLENLWCTMLGEQCIVAGAAYDGFSLEAVTKKYLGIERDKSLQKSFIGHTGPFSAEQIDYAGDDSEYMLDIAENMQKKAKEDGVLKIWRIESNAVQAFADIEFYGQLIHREKWERNMQENLQVAAAAKRELDKFFAPFVERVMTYDDEGNCSWDGLDINYDSVPEVLNVLKKMKIRVDGVDIADTSKKTQKKIQDNPVIKALTKYRAAMKGYTGFGAQYLDRIHPVTGRVHFRFNQYGTDTGRPACRDKLNCLNIPRDNRYRECFGTDPDRLISTVDFNGAELRILADLSGDKLMINGYNSGVDFHCFVASLLFNREVTKKNENAHLRTPTKTLNFGRVIHLSRKQTHSIQGNPHGTILSESFGNGRSVQRLTAQTERLRLGTLSA